MHTYRKRWTTETEWVIEQVRDDGHIRRVDPEHAGYLAWAAEHEVPEVPWEPPSMAELKEAKKAEIATAYAAALAQGIEAMPTEYPGKIFSIQEASIGRFAVALQRAELANQATLEAVYTIDDEPLLDVPFSVAKAGFLACWNAAAALDAQYRAKMKAIDAATSAEDLEVITCPT
jgi:hypothetical protein